MAFDFRPYLGQGDQDGAALQDDFHTAFAGMNSILTHEQASLNLQLMGFVGITEQFEETVRTLCQYLGIPAPRSAPQVNLNPHKQTPVLGLYRDRLDRGILRQIEAMTQYDRLLYEQGLTYFKRQSAQPNAPAPALRALPTARAMFYRSRRWFWRWAVQAAPPLAALRR